MNNTQEKIARFLIYSHKMQRLDSDYFEASGGISISKIAGNLSLTEQEVMDCVEDMNIEVTERPGLRPKLELFAEIEAIDVQRLQEIAEAQQLEFEEQENERVTRDIIRAKNLNLI